MIYRLTVFVVLAGTGALFAACVARPVRSTLKTVSGELPAEVCSALQEQEQPYRLDLLPAIPEPVVTPTPIPGRITVSGKVRMRIVVAASGRVEAVENLEGPEPLRGPTKDAVQMWRFSPVTCDGEPVSSFFVHTLSYRVR